MKKKWIIGIIVVIIVISVVAGIFYFVNKNNKEYEIVKVENYNYFILKESELYGVIDNKGNKVIEPKFEEIKIPNPEKAIFICYIGDEIQVLNENGEKLLTQFSEVEPIRLKNIISDLMYEKSVLRYKKDDKYGIIDFEGKEITKAIYDSIDSVSYKEGELLVEKDNKYGIINIKGREILKSEYDEISIDRYFTEDLDYKFSGYIVAIRTEQGYRYGYISYKGKEILKPEYNEILRITEVMDNENVYLINSKNGQYGITRNNKVILENEYQSIRYDYTNEVVVIEKTGKYGIATLDSEILVPVQYDQIDITGIYIYAKNSQGVTVYNSNGNQVNINSNIAIINTENEKYRIRINNQNGTKYGVIDKEGKQLIEEKYNYIEYLYDNYFIVSGEKGKLGILNDKAEEVVKLEYDSIQRIQDTKLIQATLSENKLLKIYSRKMEVICEMVSANMEINKDYIKVNSETETRYFDKEGKELTNMEVFKSNKIFAKNQDGKWGFIDIDGNVIVEYKYDRVTELNKFGFASVKLDDKWGVINENGEIIVNPIYEFEGQTEPTFIGKYYRVTFGFGENYYTNGK